MARLLIVEDNHDTRTILGDLCEAWGHDVKRAADGAAAVACFDADGAVDVALIDIGLPDIDGYEVARRIRARAPAQRPYLVALTGHSDEDGRAVAAGFDVHVRKPVEPDALERLLAAR